MNCPRCKEKTRVIDSRSDRDNVHFSNIFGTVRRIRLCEKCGNRFKTIEMTDEELDNWGAANG